MKAFGTEFIVVNNVRQPIDRLSLTPEGNYYIHLATVRRGFKEYVAYCDELRNLVWIEQADPSEPGLLKVIEDINEWTDLKDFLFASGLLTIDSTKEIALSEKGIAVNKHAKLKRKKAKDTMGLLARG